MPYTPTTWTEGVTTLGPTNLNHLETGVGAAIPKDTVTTAGDIIYATGSAAVTRLALGATNQLLVAGASAPTWGMKITTSTLAGGPPGSPADTDVWIATGVDGAGARWMFQYNAGSGSSFKWEFVGGSSLRSDVATTQTTASTTNVDLATAQSVTLSRGGDYDFVWACEGSNNTTGQAIITALTKGGVELVNRGITTAVANNTEDLFGSFRVTGISAADVVKMQYRVTANTGAFMNRSLTVTPVRVS